MSPPDAPPPDRDPRRPTSTGRGSSFSTPALADDEADRSAPPVGDDRSLPLRLIAWISGNLGLKALALILALMMWQLVREKIEKEETLPGVSVRVVDLPAGIRIQGPGLYSVTLTLKGTQAEVARARVNYEKDRPEITVRMATPDAGLTEGVARLSERESFGFPFLGNEVVQPLKTPLEIPWYRVSTKSVPVVPRFRLPYDRPDIRLPTSPAPAAEPTTVAVTGPERVVRDLKELPTDEVDVAEWLKGKPDVATTPLPWSMGFDGWRTRGELRDRTLVTIEPEIVKGKLKLKLNAARELSLPILTASPAGLDLSAYADWEVAIEGSSDYDASARTLRVGLTGDSQAIEELALKSEGWGLLVVLPPPPRSGDEPPTSLKVPVDLLVRRDSQAVLRLQGTPSVFVSLKPKPKPK